MSQFPDTDGNHRTDSAADDLKQALQSLKPRTTIDREQLLARLQADETEAHTVAPRLAEPQPSPVHSRSANWWPMLTALSWLVTAGVWWSSTHATSPHDSEAAGVMAAVAHADGVTSPAIVAVGTSGMNQLGESLDAAEQREAVESPALVESQASTASPYWLTMLGIDVAGFTADTAEQRWERMQVEADAPRQSTVAQSASGPTPSATYASLRDEFDAPIRRNWLQQ